jgi:hypothetical protein
MQRPPDPQLHGFLETYYRHISVLALTLREVIVEEAPDASESTCQVFIQFRSSGLQRISNPY